MENAQLCQAVRFFAYSLTRVGISLADKFKCVFKKVPPCGAGYLLNDQKVTEESPGWTQSELRRHRPPGPPCCPPRTPGVRGWRPGGFFDSLPRPKVVARRFGRSSSFPTAAPAARRANVTRQALEKKRFSGLTTTAAPTLSARIGQALVQSAQRVQSGRSEAAAGVRSIPRGVHPIGGPEPALLKAKSKPSVSGFDLERRSKGANAIFRISGKCS